MRAIAASILRPPLPRWQRIAWVALVAWLALRFATLAVEVSSRPLYPWDAWDQWATKARVWYELGHIVPFVPAEAGLGGAGAYFDTSPANPSTVPLLQAWSAIALGRWDDAATNWPWLLMLVALTLAVYGALRDADLPPLGALAAAYLVASLPLLDTHVALAGYPDLMLSGVYALAALALHRWALRRDFRDAALALVLALACTTIDASGRVLMMTLLPGVVVALWPRQGIKVVAWSFGAGLLVLLFLMRGTPLLSALPYHLDYASPWHALGEDYFLLGSWHLLWYVALVLAAIGARRLVRQPLAPLAMVVTSALAWIIIAAAFSDDLAGWFPSARAVNRLSLHVAPLLACLCTLLWRELTALEASPLLAPSPPPAEADATAGDA